MNIVLVSPEWKPASDAMLAALSDIAHATADRVPGCSSIPCICAVDDAGKLRKEWRGDSASFDANDIATWAAADGTPEPASLPPVAINRLAFIRLLKDTGGTLASQWASARADANMALFWEMFDATTIFERDDPDVAAGLGALVALGYLTSEAKDAVLAAWPVV